MAITSEMVKKLREITGLGLMDCKKALEESNGDFEKAEEYLRKQGLKTAGKRSGREMKEGRIEAAMKPDRSACVILELNTETDFVARTDEFITYTKNFTEFFLTQGPEAGSGDDDNFASIDYKGTPMHESIAGIIAKTGENTLLGRWQRYQKSGNEYLDYYIHPGNALGVMVKFDLGNASLKDNPKFQELSQDIAMQIVASAPIAISSADVNRTLVDKERAILMGQLEQEEEKSGKKKPQEIREKIIDGRIKKFFEESCLLEQTYIKDQNKKVGDVITEMGKQLGGNISVIKFARYQLGEVFK
jgi:elongation factor Ts